MYYRTLAPHADAAQRVTLSKVLLLVVALPAAYVAANKPADILFLVSAAFSLAASAFFPVLVMGISGHAPTPPVEWRAWWWDWWWPRAIWR